VLALPSTLEAHQKRTTRRPVVTATVTQTRNDVPAFDPQPFDANGSDPDTIHAAAVTPSAALVLVRNDAGDLDYTTAPFGGAWTNLDTIGATNPVAIAIAPDGSELCLAYGDGNDVKVRTSADDGATWTSSTTLVTEASAIGSIALAYNDDGDICVFYVLTTSTTLKRLRRTSGSWAGSGTTWSRTADVATLTGVAAAYIAGNFVLCITGTAATTLHPRAWSALMGDTALPANTWSSLRPIAEADAASGITHGRPFIAPIGAAVFVTVVQTEADNVAYERIYFAHTPADGTLVTAWTEPVPLALASEFGAALSFDAADECLYLTTANTAYASELTADRVYSADVVALSWRISSESFRLRLELENHANDHDFESPILRPGHDLTVVHGFASGTAGATENGLTLRALISRVTRSFEPGKNRCIVEAIGPVDQLATFRATQAWTATAASTRGAIFRRLAARVGLELFDGTGDRAPSTAWTTDTPSFAIAVGEYANATLARLMAPTADHIQPAQTLKIVGFDDAEASTYAYGDPTDLHDVLSLTLRDEPPGVNWARVEGADRYAEDFAHADLRHGARFALLRDPDVNTDGEASAAATGALERLRVRDELGELVVPANVGQELYDVITVSCPPMGVSEVDYRVTGLGLDYRRGPQPAPVYNSVLTLGRL